MHHAFDETSVSQIIRLLGTDVNRRHGLCSACRGADRMCANPCGVVEHRPRMGDRLALAVDESVILRVGTDHIRIGHIKASNAGAAQAHQMRAGSQGSTHVAAKGPDVSAG